MTGRQPTPPLTGQERAVLLRVVQGKTNKTIAAELGISVATVKYYLRRLGARLGQPSKTALAV